MNPDGAEAYRPLASRLDESKGIASSAFHAVRCETTRLPEKYNPGVS